jgi:hypothetical protein
MSLFFYNTIALGCGTYAEKWDVLKKNLNQQSLGIEQIFQKLYVNSYCDDWNFRTGERSQMLILWV